MICQKIFSIKNFSFGHWYGSIFFHLPDAGKNNDFIPALASDQFSTGISSSWKSIMAGLKRAQKSGWYIIGFYRSFDLSHRHQNRKSKSRRLWLKTGTSIERIYFLDGSKQIFKRNTFHFETQFSIIWSYSEMMKNLFQSKGSFIWISAFTCNWLGIQSWIRFQTLVMS